MALWSHARSPRTALLLAAVGLCLVRARDQPGLDLTIGGSTATVVPADLALLALLVVVILELARSQLARAALPASAAGLVFCGLIVGTALANGTAAFIAGAKLAELAVIGIGVIVLLRTRSQFEAIVDILILVTLAADAVGLAGFVTHGGGRQASFLGEHDFAALATLPLLYGLARLAGDGQRRAWVAITAGAVGCILGAALASLLGLYLGALALLGIAGLQRRLQFKQLAVTVVVVAAVSGATLVLRSGELGFLQSWFGKPPSRSGQYASSWSQRLIYVYVGGRVFAAHPLLGTGWYGNLPPRTFAVYLPDARRRFSDQPANYFPPADRPFVPQQAFDQVLYELGVVGGLALLTLFVALARAAIRVASRSRGAFGPLAAAWLLAELGALAGEGLFGGTPLAATFWLVAGTVVAFGIPGRSLS